MSELLDPLAAAWSELARQWLETRLQWQDAVALEFEGCCWNELQHDTQELLRSARGCEDILSRALSSTG